jgi:NAD(P)-dependent dehydrogenase (short-subunit alcohol dehydrogenase family)
MPADLYMIDLQRRTHDCETLGAKELQTMDLGLTSKTVVVTGATSNIGRAIALGMAAERVKLVAVGRDKEAGARVVAAAKAAGAADAYFLAVDLLEPSAADRIAAATLDRFGAIDVLVNNVGGNYAMGPFAESDPGSWQKDLDITLMTVLRVTRAVLPQMISRQDGRIINIGSTAGTVGDYMLAVYSAAKGAVHAFTRVLAKEVGQHNVTVNCVAPYATFPEDPAAMSTGSRFHPQNGFFTQVLKGLDPSEVDKLRRTGPLPRTVAKADEVAAAVLYLASQQAAFVTGQILHVDGGTLL